MHNIFILSSEKFYGATLKDGLIHFHETQPRGINIYAATLQETSDTVGLLPKFYYRYLREWSELNILRFDSPNTMYAILSIMYDSV